MANEVPKTSRFSALRAAQAIIGVAVGVALMWLALRNVDGKEFVQALSNIRPMWIVIAIALFAVDMALRVQRWRLLLRSRVRLSYGRVAEALIVGYAANFVLPARLGELFRADFLKRRTGVSRAGALGSIIVERIFDGVIVLICLDLGIWLSALPFNGIFAKVAVAGGVAVVLVCTATVLVAVRERWLANVPWAWLRSRTLDVSRTIAASTDVIGSVAIFSILLWVCEGFVFDTVLLAVGVHARPASVLLTLGMASLSTLIPSAPGYAGSYQLAFVLALATFGANAALGVLAASEIQIFLFGGLTVIGIIIYAFSQRFRSAHAVRDAQHLP